MVEKIKTSEIGNPFVLMTVSANVGRIQSLSDSNLEVQLSLLPGDRDQSVDKKIVASQTAELPEGAAAVLEGTVLEAGATYFGEKLEGPLNQPITSRVWQKGDVWIVCRSVPYLDENSPRYVFNLVATNYEPVVVKELKHDLAEQALDPNNNRPTKEIQRNPNIPAAIGATASKMKRYEE